MENKNTSALLIRLTKEEHRLIKDRANKADLSIKELILIAVYNLVENNPELIHKEN